MRYFWDFNCTEETDFINWGNVTEGSQYSVTLFAKNIKNTPVTLTMRTENWIPVNASTYLSVDWNYLGEILQPEAAAPTSIVFYLQVAEDAGGIEDFSFDLVIDADEYPPES